MLKINFVRVLRRVKLVCNSYVWCFKKNGYGS